jgi:hypothetical protein
MAAGCCIKETIASGIEYVDRAELETLFAIALRIEHGMTRGKRVSAGWRQMTGQVVPEKARLFICMRERVLFGACVERQISARNGAFPPFLRKG